MSTFKMRTTKPGAGNKYYITKAKGGYSDAIKGSPTDKDCDVLANCVGYAFGRFNEIGGYGYCKYLRPVNAENFMQYKGDLEVGQTPKLGACMVWQKGGTLSGSDGAGHVAIVEKVISATEVYTSESGYGSSTPFWNQTRKKGDGSWGMGGSYKFLGFIYNPAPCCKSGSSSEKTNTSSGTNKDTSKALAFKVGDVVNFTGSKHYTSANATSGVSCKAGKAKVTAISKGAKHPYHLVAVSGSGSTVYGWVDEAKVKKISTSNTSKALAFKVGDVVNFTGSKHYESAKATSGVSCKGGKAKVTAVSKGAKHPYHLVAVSGSGSTVYGWVDEATVKKISTSNSGTALAFKVGDVVKFTGSKHYESANATSGSSCKAGKAKVTAISKGAKHPYHLISVSGSGSTVYGWVDAAKVSK